MYRSNKNDFGLDIEIELTERKLGFLKELKEFREGLRARHGVEDYKENKKGKISRVTCLCGETTIYKVGLNSINDFKCPKE